MYLFRLWFLHWKASFLAVVLSYLWFISVQQSRVSALFQNDVRLFTTIINTPYNMGNISNLKAGLGEYFGKFQTQNGRHHKLANCRGRGLYKFLIYLKVNYLVESWWGRQGDKYYIYFLRCARNLKMKESKIAKNDFPNVLSALNHLGVS